MSHTMRNVLHHPAGAGCWLCQQLHYRNSISIAFHNCILATLLKRCQIDGRGIIKIRGKLMFFSWNWGFQPVCLAASMAAP